MLGNTSCFLQWPFFRSICLIDKVRRSFSFGTYLSLEKDVKYIPMNILRIHSFIRQHVYQINQLHLTEDVSSIMSAVESVFFIKYIYEVYQDLISTLKCFVEFRFQRSVQFESYLGTKLVKLTTTEV